MIKHFLNSSSGIMSFISFCSPCIQSDDMSLFSGPLQLYSYAPKCPKETEALLELGHPNPKTSSAGRWTTSTCCGHHGSFIVRKGEGRPPKKKNLKARISEIKNINLETEYTVLIHIQLHIHNVC